MYTVAASWCAATPGRRSHSLAFQQDFSTFTIPGIVLVFLNDFMDMHYDGMVRNFGVKEMGIGRNILHRLHFRFGWAGYAWFMRQAIEKAGDSSAGVHANFSRGYVKATIVLCISIAS